MYIKKTNMIRDVSKSPLRHIFKQPVVVFVSIVIFSIISIFGSALMKSLESFFIRTAVGISDGLRRPSSEIVIAQIKKKGEETNFEWDQKNFQSFINKLHDYNAKMAIVDFGTIDTTDLKINKQMISDLPIVLSYSFYSTFLDLPPKDDFSDNTASANKSTLRNIVGYPSKPMDDSQLLGMAGVNQASIIDLQMNLAGHGFSNLFPNSRGLVIDQPLAVRYKGRAYPALGIVAYAKWHGFTPILKENPHGRPVGVSVGSEQISTGPDTKVTINFIGPMRTFPSTSIDKILDGKAPPEAIAGKIVIAFIDHPSKNALFNTPVGRMSSAEVQANILDNLLRKRMLHSILGWQVAVPAFILIALAFLFGLHKVSLRRRFLLCLGLIACIWTIALALIYFLNIWIPTVQITLFIVILFVELFLLRLFAEDIPRLKLARTYSWRMAKSSIAKISQDESLIDPKGHECQVTALSLDIKGFGHISDKLEAVDFNKFVLQFRILVSEILIKHGSMIESWSGDDCIAVFGAPIPMAEPTLAACLAALDLQRTLIAHQSSWNKHFDIERLRLGIGIQEGKAVAGDFGTGFSIIGGAVEAAKQLKRLNRFYKTWTLVGDSVAGNTNSAAEYRALDPVHLWGEPTPSVIHEMIGETGKILPSMKAYKEARTAYLMGDFSKAADLFRLVLSAHPNDGPSKLFLKRSRILIQDHPKSWDGVWKSG